MEISYNYKLTKLGIPHEYINFPCTNTPCHSIVQWLLVQTPPVPLCYTVVVGGNIDSLCCITPAVVKYDRVTMIRLTVTGTVTGKGYYNSLERVTICTLYKPELMFTQQTADCCQLLYVLSAHQPVIE